MNAQNQFGKNTKEHINPYIDCPYEGYHISDFGSMFNNKQCTCKNRYNIREHGTMFTKDEVNEKERY